MWCDYWTWNLTSWGSALLLLKVLKHRKWRDFKRLIIGVLGAKMYLGKNCQMGLEPTSSIVGHHGKLPPSTTRQPWYSKHVWRSIHTFKLILDLSNCLMELDGWAFLMCVSVCSVVRVNAFIAYALCRREHRSSVFRFYVCIFTSHGWMVEWLGVFHHSVTRFMV